MRTKDVTKAAALYMLKNGLASYKEVAELSGRSRQLIVSAVSVPPSIEGVERGMIDL
ncbi:hypothetical protein ABIB83_008985 [Bradyrhizobium sp. I1.8.5]|uniref:hypothetical protein n=1 Tax=Bradyrhizobium sp. I1.8.5 TaxID=3156365 RepID=UPI0033910832